MFRLWTFGGLRLDGGEGPLAGAAARRRPLALLALIAASGQRGITREKLIGLLWPDRGEAQARHVLAQSLYALRKDLGAEELFLNGGSLRLNPAVISSDLQDFTAALDAGDRERAVAAYTGPFLEGFYLSEAPEFEHWVDEERSRLQSRYRSALEGAAAQLHALGEPARAAELWARLVANDPLASGPVVQLVRALVASGNRSEAQRRLRAHLSVAEQEEVAVSAEIRSLERELKAEPLPEAVPPTPTPVRQTGPETTVRSMRRQRRWVLPLAVGLGLLLAIALRVGGHSSRTVSVVAVGLIESHLREDPESIARSLPDLITTQLAQVPGLTVVSRGRLLEVLGSAARLPGSGTLARGARAAGAREIIEGAVYAEPEGFRLDLRRVDLADGSVTAAVSVTGGRVSDVVERAAAALAGSFGLKAPDEPLASITSVSLVARRFYEEGLRSYYAGDRGTAAQLFDAALRDDSTFAMAAYYFALTQAGIEPDSEAALWRRATRLAPRAVDRERLLIQSVAAFSLNDVRALALAETLTVRYPDDLDGKHILGEQRFSEGDFPGALAAFLAVVRADSAGRGGQTARCRACDAMQRAVWVNLTADSLAQAERLTRELIRWKPEIGATYGLLGTVLLRRQRFAEALDAFRRQNQLNPGTVSLWEFPMQIAHRRGDFRALDSIAGAIVRLAQDPAERLYGLTWQATLKRESGRPAEALRLGRRARRLTYSLSGGSTTHAFVLLPEALALLELGRHDPNAARAAALLFDSMAAMPTYPEPRMARHRVWMWTHQATALFLARDTSMLPALERRIAEMARRSSYGRDGKMADYARGLLLEARGDWNGAAEAYARSIWSPTENHVAPRLAQALIMSGRPAEAIPVLHSWLRGPLDAANQYVPLAWGHLALADAFAATGLSDSAGWHYRWVRRAWSNVEPAMRPAAERVAMRVDQFPR